MKPYPEIFDFAEGLMQGFPKSLIWLKATAKLQAIQAAVQFFCGFQVIESQRAALISTIKGENIWHNYTIDTAQ